MSGKYKMKELSAEECTKIIQFINSLSQIDCARLVRFAKVGNPISREDLPFHKMFEKRFKELGGMTPAVSKRIGWKEWGDCLRWEDFK